MHGWLAGWMDGWTSKQKGKLFFMTGCQLKVVGRIMELENYLATHMAKIASGKNR